MSMLLLTKAAIGPAERSPSPAFASAMVQIDELPWSTSLAAQLSAWASLGLTLVMLPGGKAVVSRPRAFARFGEYVVDQWAGAHQSAGACKTHAPGTLGVLRFAPELVAYVQARSSDNTAQLHVPGSSLVQVTPAALFRYYWRLRALTLRLPSPDPSVEEDALSILRHVVKHAWPCSGPTANPAQERYARHRALAVDAQAIMSQALASRHPIAEIARSLSTSPFHLAHVFRTEIGVSVHQYLVQLRLVTAIERLREGSSELSKLALDLGFSHHSHFSSVFHRVIGYSPRAVRRMLTAQTFADLGSVGWD